MEGRRREKAGHRALNEINWRKKYHSKFKTRRRARGQKRGRRNERLERERYIGLYQIGQAPTCEKKNEGGRENLKEGKRGECVP